jgi:hypothetical protein
VTEPATPAGPGGPRASHELVPLTGSDVVGPLGVAHLPRLWLMGTLARTGLLAERRTADPRGFDVAVTVGLGINSRALHGHLSTLPSYMECEKWVRENAQTVDEAAIARVNEKILKTHDNLPIWDSFHAWLTACKNQPHDPIVPAISSRSNGPMGLNHVAKLWVKMLLDAVDMLPGGYHAGRFRIEADAHGWRKRVPAEGLFDVAFLEEFGVDVDACSAYVKSNLPDYRTFEHWFITTARKYGPTRAAPFNALRINVRAETAAAQRAAVGLDDPEMVWSYMLSDLIDWKGLHDAALATGIRPTGGSTGGRRR